MPTARTAAALPLAQIIREYMAPEFNDADVETLLAKCYEQIASIRAHHAGTPIPAPTFAYA